MLIFLIKKTQQSLTTLAYIPRWYHCTFSIPVPISSTWYSSNACFFTVTWVIILFLYTLPTYIRKHGYYLSCRYCKSQKQCLTFTRLSNYPGRVHGLYLCTWGFVIPLMHGTTGTGCIRNQSLTFYILNEDLLIFDQMNEYI